MQVGLYTQLLPLLSMLVVLALFRQLHSPEAIPGFRRLTGFIWLLLLTALALFLLMRTRIWIVFWRRYWYSADPDGRVVPGPEMGV